MSTLIALLLFVGLIHNAAGACTLPTDIRGTWISSDRGSLTFNSSHVIDYPVYNQGNLAFACETLAGDYYVLLSEEFTLFSSPAIAVMCVTFTSLKESMYKYQIFTSSLPDADYQRIRFAATGTSVDTSLACTDQGATDYYLLVQDGQISSVKQQCPDIFLGTFGFSFNESDCANNTGSLDVCSDLNTLSFNYSDCNTQQAYSSGGSLNCLYSTTSGDVTTLNVYNLDATTDESTTYRFTCYMIEQPSGSSNVYATQHPKDCHVNQTTTYVPAPGANLTMLASVTCVPTTTTEDAVSQASLIAGLAAGFIVLLLLALLIICFYCYKKKSKVQPAGKAPIDTDHGDQHPDTTWAETTVSTPTPVEIEQDALSVLHETELNNVFNKQPKPKEGASISLKGNKGSSLQQMKRNDRQSSVRFSVSNLKKRQQANRKTKTESKAKGSSKPNVPKKRLPWPALFLPPENDDTRKEKEREKKRKLAPHNTQVVLSQNTDLEIVEDVLKEMEQADSIGIIQDEATSKPTGLNEDNEKAQDLKDDKNLEKTTKAKNDTQEIAEDVLKKIEQADSIGFLQDEARSKPTRLNEDNEKAQDLKDDKNLEKTTEAKNDTQEIAEDVLKEIEQADSIGFLQDEARSKPTRLNEDNEKAQDLKDDKNLEKTTEAKKDTQEQSFLENEVLSRGSVTGCEEETVVNEVKEIHHTDALNQETTKNNQIELVKEKEIKEVTDLSNENKDNVQDSNILKNNAINSNDSSNNEIHIEDENLIDQNITEKDDTVVLKTACEEMTEAKDEILYKKNNTTDVTRNESTTDSGVYSNSSSVEPNIDIEAVLSKACWQQFFRS
ncbi:uncharacterized protein LOC117329282 isoform X1 [Pecten maximus]|uniref:uncharacterized protein LOC117329282 isoform X1 n=1 Tax=Pecten maximus TaxID=6579 RepID=UPI001458A909|nr:uncharacterized protein LOC117329282 isoform X1 [Pecten maximus]